MSPGVGRVVSGTEGLQGGRERIKKPVSYPKTPSTEPAI